MPHVEATAYWVMVKEVAAASVVTPEAEQALWKAAVAAAAEALSVQDMLSTAAAARGSETPFVPSPSRREEREARVGPARPPEARSHVAARI